MQISRRTVLTAPLAFGILGSATVAASEFEPDELDAKAVAALMANRATVVFDVRTREEFQVSHIAGAIQVDPDAEVDAVLKLAADRLRTAEVILYCTLGTRSMGLGINIQDHLFNAGAKGVHVMKDGIIAWANADLPLVDHKGATRFVHPSDQATRDRLTDPKRARFEPRK